MYKYVIHWIISQMVPGNCGETEQVAEIKAVVCERNRALDFYENQKSYEGYLQDSGITIKSVELDSVKID